MRIIDSDENDSNYFKKDHKYATDHWTLMNCYIVIPHENFNDLS